MDDFDADDVLAADAHGAAADAAGMSIGGFSRLTGIPVATLRSWERRYGFPSPERRASGHRRYPVALVERLRLVHRALENGHRPAEVVHASTEALSALLGLRAPEPDPSPSDDATARLLALVRDLDRDGLARGLRLAFDQAGARGFISLTALPLLRSIGVAWEAGELGVVHEHFASEGFKALLSERWGGYAGGDRAIVCAALPGEQHDLGLHLAACLLGLAGAAAVFLGANTPLEDIALAARQRRAVAVLVASSAAADPGAAVPLLAALRRLVPAEVAVAVGGLPAAAPAGVTRLASFDALEAWAATL